MIVKKDKMAEYTKYKHEEYLKLIDQNSFRNEFICPNCYRSFPLGNASLGEKIYSTELHYIGSKPVEMPVPVFSYRFCPKCMRKREKSSDTTYKIKKASDKTIFVLARIALILFILGVVGFILVLCFDYFKKDEFTSLVGLFAAAFALMGPVIGLFFLVFSLLERIFSPKKIDFDLAIKNNAVVRL